MLQVVLSLEALSQITFATRSSDLGGGGVIMNLPS